MDGDDDIDRISELPEPILHIILSRLPNLKDVVRTSVLSKRWKSMWLSFPDLDFQEKFFSPEVLIINVQSLRDKEKGRQIFRKRQEFIAFVNDTLLRRRQNNVKTRKFMLEISFPDDLSLASPVDQWIDCALDASVEDFCLRLRTCSAGMESRYKLPEVLLDSKKLSVLDLMCCRIEPSGEIRLPSLRKLTLISCYIKEHTFQKLFSSCPEIEHLDLSACFGLKDIYSFSSLKLKHVKVFMSGDSNVGKVDVKAPNLECLMLYGNSVSYEINVDSCHNLKKFEMSGGELLGVPETYTQDLISNLPYLENLFLNMSYLRGSVDISFPRLKKFGLCGCSNGLEVKIDAPNLLHFEFWGSNTTSILLMSTSSHLEVKLSLDHPKELSNLWFVDLMIFFKNFDGCKVLTLCVLSEMAVFIPEELREELLPSLYSVNHLELFTHRPPTCETVSLVDGLLWICPRVETLSIASRSDNKYLKFVHGEQMDNDEVPYCCRSHPRRCWRHFLREVKIVNFHENEDEKNLHEYFVQNAKTLERIHVLD